MAKRAVWVGVDQLSGVVTRTRLNARPSRSPRRSPPSNGVAVVVNVRFGSPVPEIDAETTTLPSDFFVTASIVCVAP